MEELIIKCLIVAAWNCKPYPGPEAMRVRLLFLVEQPPEFTAHALP